MIIHAYICSPSIYKQLCLKFVLETARTQGKEESFLVPKELETGVEVVNTHEAPNMGDYGVALHVLYIFNPIKRYFFQILHKRNLKHREIHVTVMG